MATKTKLNFVLGDQPVSIVINRSEPDNKIRTIEVNNKKFSNQRMAKAFLQALGFEDSKIAEIFNSQPGPVVEEIAVEHTEPEKVEVTEDCVLGGDTTNDCEDCAYSGDYHDEGEECVERSDAEVVKPKRENKPRKKAEPIAGYPKWVVRDPQDTIQFHLMQEAKNAGYNAKIMESYRETNGFIAVGFNDDFKWEVRVHLATGTGVNLVELDKRLNALEAGDPAKNEALVSSEKRYAVVLAKALAASYLLAFNETIDVATPSPEVLASKERRKNYNR